MYLLLDEQNILRGDFSIRFNQTSKNYPSWSVLTKSPGKLVQNVLNTYLVSINKISWENGSKQLEPISQQFCHTPLNSYY